MRHSQLPAATPGTFIRADPPRESISCIGITASPDVDDSAIFTKTSETFSALISRPVYSDTSDRMRSSDSFSHHPRTVLLSWVPVYTTESGLWLWGAYGFRPISPSKAKRRTFIPGRTNSSMSSLTSSVMMPRSSATSPDACRPSSRIIPNIALSSSLPGAAVHSPFSAVSSSAGTAQHAEKPLK